MPDYAKEVKKGDWKKVSSSHINAVMWVRNSTNSIERAVGRMYVEFNESQKRIYLYDNVAYDDFYYFWKGAPSKGRYFHYKFRNEHSRYNIKHIGASR
jgi:hypothetical protein